MSHHSSHEDPERDEQMHKMMKQIFGEYPAGKLNQQDEGALAMAVAVENGKVVIHFPKPVQWIGFTGDGAVELAQLLLARAREAGITKPIVIRVPSSQEGTKPELKG